jgi:predicted dehydrogenase
VRTTRIGLAGYGFGGRIFHAPLLAAAPGVEFAGVVTRSPERRAEVERDHPGTPVFGDLAALAGAGAQGVAISTPAATHIPLALEAIGLGLAVVVDKPFALDAAQARTAVEAAEAADVVLSVYQNRRWDSDLLTVRRLLDHGDVGEVTLFESAFERFSTDPVPAAGGGIALDFGSHLIDQALLLFGPVAIVSADGPLDERFFAVLEHRGGMTSHISGDWRQGAPGPRFRVRGSAGSYTVDGMDGQEEALIAGRTPDADWGPAARRRRRAGPERARPLGHLLPGVRRRRARRGTGPRRPARRHRQPDRHRRDPRERSHAPRDRALALLHFVVWHRRFHPPCKGPRRRRWRSCGTSARRRCGR